MIAESSKVIRSTIPRSAKVFRDCLVCDSCCGESTSIGDGAIVRDSNLAEGVEIGRRNSLRSATIGLRTYTGSDCNISHATIGSYCAISWNVSIGGADHACQKLALTPKFRITRNPDDAIVPYPESWSNVCRIGSDVWLASGVCVLRGLTIGDGCVVGANSVVTRDLPPYSIAVGAPARVIRYRFSSSTIDFIQTVRWWEFPVAVLKENADLFDLTDEMKIVRRLKEIVAKLGGVNVNK